MKRAAFLGTSGSCGSTLRGALRAARDMLRAGLAGDGTGGAPPGESRYFVHIPKTAGLSVKEFLRRRDPGTPPSHRWFEGQFVHELLARCTEARRCDLFSGHFLGFLDPLLGRATRKATLLRDPLNRAISHFLHVRRDPLLPHHEEFKRSSLSEVLADPILRRFAVNVQARYLAALVDDPSWLDHTMQLRSKPAHDDELLERARAGLAMVEVVGLHEDLPRFLRTLAGAWSLRGPADVPMVNVADNRAGLVVGDDERARLAEFNRVDRTLYDEVAARIGDSATGVGSQHRPGHALQ